MVSLLQKHQHVKFDRIFFVTWPRPHAHSQVFCVLHRKPGIEPSNVYVSRVLSSGVVMVFGRGNIDLSPVLQAKTALLLICSP